MALAAATAWLESTDEPLSDGMVGELAEAIARTVISYVLGPKPSESLSAAVASASAICPFSTDRLSYNAPEHARALVSALTSAQAEAVNALLEFSALEVEFRNQMRDWRRRSSTLDDLT